MPSSFMYGDPNMDSEQIVYSEGHGIDAAPARGKHQAVELAGSAGTSWPTRASLRKTLPRWCSGLGTRRPEVGHRASGTDKDQCGSEAGGVCAESSP